MEVPRKLEILRKLENDFHEILTKEIIEVYMEVRAMVRKRKNM